MVSTPANLLLILSDKSPSLHGFQTHVCIFHEHRLVSEADEPSYLLFALVVLLPNSATRVRLRRCNVHFHAPVRCPLIILPTEASQLGPATFVTRRLCVGIIAFISGDDERWDSLMKKCESLGDPPSRRRQLRIGMNTVR